MNLYHYCPNHSLIRILETRELHLSDLTLSNDSMEGRWVHRILEERCSTKIKNTYDRENLVNHLNDYTDLVGGAGFCMSTHGDTLSQWRGYADNGGGVSIGFNAEYLKALVTKYEENPSLRISLIEVEYDRARQNERVDKILDVLAKPLEAGAFRMPTLLTPDTEETKKNREAALTDFLVKAIGIFPLLFSLKNPAFAEEHEWRMYSYIINTPIKTPKKTDEEDGLNYRASSDRIVRFMRIKLDALDVPPIKEIILGPRNITPLKTVEGLLATRGFPDVTIRKSDASYR